MIPPVRVKVKHQDWGNMDLHFSNVERSVRANAARSLERSANRIAKRAQSYTPIDTEDLMNSIRVVKKRGARGRNEFVVIMGDMIGAQRGIDIDQYALVVHEFYELWASTIARRAEERERGGPADKRGGHFMTRALADDRELATHDMIEVIARTIRQANTSTTPLKIGNRE